MPRRSMLMVTFFVFAVLWCRGASAQAVYYVDPDYTGVNGTADGSTARPWPVLGPGEWNTINTNLATGDVLVYFSARQASTPAAQEYGAGLRVERTSTSSYRLTLDGMSKYNTNDARPSDATWVTNGAPDTYKMKLINSGAGYALGWASAEGKRNNITMRGFEATGPSGRILFGGDNVVVENMYVHDITGVGPGMVLMYATYSGTCTVMGVFHNVTIRDNVIARTFGEGLYIGGTQNCPAVGNTHDTILIENNTITDPGVNGGQGDGIDIKDGLLNLTVRRNTITSTHNGDGITMAGGYNGQDQNLVVEWNQISQTSGAGIIVGSNWGDPHDYTIRYNTVTGSGHAGISLSGGVNSTIDIFNVSILYNTVANNTGVGIYASYTDHLSVLDNLVFNALSSSTLQIAVNSAVRLSGTAINDYNLYCPGYSDSNANAISGGHNKIITDCSGLTVDARHPGFDALHPRWGEIPLP